MDRRQLGHPRRRAGRARVLCAGGAARREHPEARDQGRLAPVRSELLPALPPRRPPGRGGRHLDDAHRLSLCAAGARSRRRMRPSIVFALIAVLAALGLGACGESPQDKAKSTVCDARADISKQVDQLKGLTLSTATIDGVQSSLKAINSDLSKIRDAQGDLSGDRRQQVQDASKTFTSQLQSIAGSVGKSTSLSEARAQLTSALQQLGDAYKQSFAKVDC